MLKHRMVAFLAVAAMVGGGAGLASANSIGINFTNSNAGGADTLTAAQTAGVLPQANWNNVSLHAAFSASATALTDSTGAATAASVSVVARSTGYDISSTTGTQPDASNADQIMMNGGAYGNNGTFPNNINGTTAGGTASGASVVAQVSNVPYSVYNVYVYGLVDHGATTEGLAIGTGSVDPTNPTAATFNATSTVWELTPTPNALGYIDGNSPSGFTYTPATSTNSASPTPNADYAEFTGVTGSSFAVGAIYGTNASPAIDGIQIVNASSSIPEPATLALAGVGAAGLLLRRKRKLA